MAWMLGVLCGLQAAESKESGLYELLRAECGKAFEARRLAVAALKTPEDVRKRQEELRRRFVEALDGFPERTPLNARVVGELRGDGHRVEKVIYESRPGHAVTGNVYLPEGKGPHPGVLIPCGHSDNGKAAEAYQRAAILLARNGFVALIYDPIGQGERRQLLTPEGKPALRGTTDEHTMAGIPALLVGWSAATFRIWDGLRSLDYLASRPDVDPKRLGCTGNSGGGTLTSYLMALDDRIAAAAPSCYLTSLDRLFATIGPQDAEQNITGQVAFGMDHADYVTMRGPKPTLMLIASQDFFDQKGSWDSFREAKQVYGILGHAERVDLAEFNDKHGFSQPRREAAVRWMRRWLMGVDDAPAEPAFPVWKDADLQCTKSGQVLADGPGVSVFDLCAARAKELAAARKPFDRAALPRRLAGTLRAGAEVSDGKVRFLALERKVPGRKGLFGADEREAFLGLHLGTPLLGIRVRDAVSALQAANATPELHGTGPAALVALHAALLIPERVGSLLLEDMLVSWDLLARSRRSSGQLAGAVPGVLADYDLPDLVAALAPKPVTIRGAVDPEGKPLPAAEVETVYARARAAYRAAGAEDKFKVEAK
jgi:dienelactone hydrolase